MAKPLHWNGEHLDALFRILRLWREHRRAGPLPSDGTATYELIRVIDEVFAPQRARPEAQAVLDAARAWHEAAEGTSAVGQTAQTLIRACETAWPKPQQRICTFDGCSAFPTRFYTNSKHQMKAVCRRHHDWLEANT